MHAHSKIPNTQTTDKLMIASGENKNNSGEAKLFNEITGESSFVSGAYSLLAFPPKHKSEGQTVNRLANK